MDEPSGLDRVIDNLRSEVTSAVRSAAVRAGVLVAAFDVSYDEAADALEALARPLGAGAVDAVLDGLDAGMAGEDVTEGPLPGLTDAPAPPEPPAPSETPRAAFRDADECAAAVVAWASERLVADPDARTASADLARSWQATDGRPLVGFGSITEAVLTWARRSGIEIDRHRTARGRGLAGVQLAAPTVDDTLPGDDTTTDVTPPADDTEAVAEVQQRPPNGGAWQSYTDLGDAAATGADDWFKV